MARLEFPRVYMILGGEVEALVAGTYPHNQDEYVLLLLENQDENQN